MVSTRHRQRSPRVQGNILISSRNQAVGRVLESWFEMLCFLWGLQVEFQAMLKLCILFGELDERPAYGSPKAMIARLKSGQLNRTKEPGEMLLKKKVWFKNVAQASRLLNVSQASSLPGGAESPQDASGTSSVSQASSLPLEKPSDGEQAGRSLYDPDKMPAGLRAAHHNLDLGANKLLYKDEFMLELSTIHGVKGETHDATLLLETRFHEFDLGTMLPYLTTEPARPTGKRKLKFMRQFYVAMSRPQHLLCLAIHSDRISESDKELLENNEGWKIKVAEFSGLVEVEG